MTLPLFSQTKLEQSVVSSHLHTHRTSNQPTSTAKTPIFSFCPLTEAEVFKLLLSSHPTTCPLDPIPSHRVVFNQVSLFLSQNNKLDAKQSGFRSGHSTETALLSVTEALRIAKADSKSSVLILLDLSAAFDTVNHQILLSTLSSLRITGIPLRWFESYHLVGLSGWPGEGRYPKHINWSLGFLSDRFLDPSSSPHTLHHWVPSYRHMASPTIVTLMTHALSLFSTRWSNGSCTDLRLPGGHLGMDERTSPTAQPGKD